MPTRSAFSPAVQDALAGRDAIVFDGECVLCSGFFRFVLRHDRRAHFHFVIAQSELGTQMFHDLGLPTDDYQTNLVVTGDEVHGGIDSFAAVMAKLPRPWPVLSVARVLPEAVKSPLYGLIARNRYAIFGRAETCLIPGPDITARFIDGGISCPTPLAS
ncbi:MAG: thiol-disulfide oxidoreductase DCC family protein [Pseudooceanicola atlanticus]